MTLPNGTAAALAKAFEAVDVEMLAVALPDMAVIDATTAALRQWNCLREQVVGKKLAQFGTASLSARYTAEDAPGGSQSQMIEVAYTPPLGSYRSCLFTPQVWEDDGREFLLLVGQNADKARAEAAIANEHRLQLALRSGGYALWDYDFRTGKTVNSPEMFDLLGFVRDSSALDFNKFNDRVHPDDKVKTIDTKIANASFNADMFQTQYRVKAENGDYIWIESVAGVVRDPLNGKPLKAVGLCRNIHEQMLALEQLRESEKSLRRTQSAAKLGSFVLKGSTASSRLSDELCHLLGLEDAIVAPSVATFERLIDPADIARFRDALMQAKSGETISGLEVTVKLRSGEVQYFQCNFEPERDIRGAVTAVHGTCQCITERKLLERKFLQAQKMEAVGQLTGGIAHDFNNLLMVVLGNLQLVDQLVKTDERASKRIKAAIEAAEKGSELTKHLLSFSRQTTLQNRELTVNELLNKNGDMLRQAIGADMELKILPAPDLWKIKADSTMLETAILNLSINARDAMRPRGGTVVIETHNRVLDAAYCANHEDLPPGDYVEVAVTDTGCGIPRENLDKVFQPFFTTKSPEAGSGLGLSMIYGFVKQSGGHVKIYSEVGHGTTVKLYLPRAKEEARAEPKKRRVKVQPAVQPLQQILEPLKQAFEPVQPAPPIARPPEPIAVAAPQPAIQDVPRKTKVLVVEDNDAVRAVAAAMIEEMGYDVVEVSSGPDALKVIEEHTDIDLVLSDVIMAGGLNGPELAVQALKLRPDLKVLFMSGYAPGSLRHVQNLPESIEMVPKPFTRADLTEKVKRALAA
jgi:signal transduction histidine kinase